MRQRTESGTEIRMLIGGGSEEGIHKGQFGDFKPVRTMRGDHVVGGGIQ